MDANVRAAAERLRQVQKITREQGACWLSSVYDTTLNPQATGNYHDDLQIVADAYLASHPADGPSDTEMLDWCQSRYAAMAYLSEGEWGVAVGGENGTLYKATTLRAAIRQAMGGGE